MKLEDLRPNASVRGVVPEWMVTVVGVVRFPRLFDAMLAIHRLSDR
jgi:hypothetical protein